MLEIKMMARYCAAPGGRSAAAVAEMRKREMLVPDGGWCFLLCSRARNIGDAGDTLTRVYFHRFEMCRPHRTTAKS